MRESVRVLGTGVVAATLATGALLTGAVDPAVELAFLPDIGKTITDAAGSVVDATVDAATGWF